MTYPSDEEETEGCELDEANGWVAKVEAVNAEDAEEDGVEEGQLERRGRFRWVMVEARHALLECRLISEETMSPASHDSLGRLVRNLSMGLREGGAM